LRKRNEILPANSRAYAHARTLFAVEARALKSATEVPPSDAFAGRWSSCFFLDPGRPYQHEPAQGGRGWQRRRGPAVGLAAGRLQGHSLVRPLEQRAPRAKRSGQTDRGEAARADRTRPSRSRRKSL